MANFLLFSLFRRLSDAIIGHQYDIAVPFLLRRNQEGGDGYEMRYYFLSADDFRLRKKRNKF